MHAMTLRLPDDVYEVLWREAYESRRSMNTLVLEAIRTRHEREWNIDHAEPWPDGSK